MLLVRLSLEFEVIREMSDGKGQQTFPNRFGHLDRSHRRHRANFSRKPFSRLLNLSASSTNRQWPAFSNISAWESGTIAVTSSAASRLRGVMAARTGILILVSAGRMSFFTASSASRATDELVGVCNEAAM